MQALLFLPFLAPGQEYEYRQLPDSSLQELLANEDFHYLKEDYREIPFWQQIRQQLSDLLEAIFGGFLGVDNVLRILLVISVLLLLFAVLKLIGVSFRAPIGNSPARRKLDFNGGEERLAEIDFPADIELARREKRWRQLIRLQYLYALWQLSQAGQLSISKGKTNRDYLYELRSASLRMEFEVLCRLFEYTWYGHFEALDPVRHKAEQSLQNILAKLAQR